jgi:hypothetical protein
VTTIRLFGAAGTLFSWFSAIAFGVGEDELGRIQDSEKEPIQPEAIPSEVWQRLAQVLEPFSG